MAKRRKKSPPKSSPKPPDPRLAPLREALFEEDLCPECLGPLDPDLVCTLCGYDAVEEFMGDELC